MIKHTVYFRDEGDLAKFKAIKNKAEWLHEHLNSEDTVLKVLDERMQEAKQDYANDLRKGLGLEPTYTDAEDVA